MASVLESQLTLLFAELPSMPIVSFLHTSLLKFSVAILMAAEMPLWLGPGYKFLQRSWTTSIEGEDRTTLHFALKLNGCLAELGWGGWKLVALPLLLKNTVSQGVLEQDPRRVLEFLASLKKANRLNTAETDLVWRDKLEKWTLVRLRDWDLKGGNEVVGS